ncbi:DUF3000 domain-containing protein [Corynebacterium sp.]|uniref:DUF3000 domain-containing protein n=1 Tax=Corynebacterium sp. TaxID=1720 RepID=UPI0026DAF5C7|nr:DUF3000 domain-containing protein [Corynebacterium sp.]MDO5075657.1 DUF3000 domain-containing protein [Corynebacterium sp.]
MTDSDATLRPESTSSISAENAPQLFRDAVDSMHSALLRPEISLGTIRPPQRLAPLSHAIGLEVDSEVIDGDAFGRLILLHDPRSEDGWEGAFRLVAYIQADMDAAVANDPFLPEVVWDWLQEGLAYARADYTNMAGTVTSTASVRFGDIGGPPRAFQLELRASWTATEPQLTPHVEAFAKVLANAAGLPPVGVTELRR